MQRKGPGDPVRQIEQVHALIDQLATAGARPVGPPLTVIAKSAAVPVARSEMHQLAVEAGMHLTRELGDCWVKAMIEADLHQPSGIIRGPHQSLDVSCPETRWLLHQNMRAGPQRPLGHRRQLVVRGGDDRHVGFEGEQLVDRGAVSPAVACHEGLRALRDRVGGADHLIPSSEGPRTLIADQPTADDRDPQSPRVQGAGILAGLHLVEGNRLPRVSPRRLTIGCGRARREGFHDRRGGALAPRRRDRGLPGRGRLHRRWDRSRSRGRGRPEPGPPAGRRAGLDRTVARHAQRRPADLRHGLNGGDRSGAPDLDRIRYPGR